MVAKAKRCMDTSRDNQKKSEERNVVVAPESFEIPLV